jgi:hypothetical protein
MHHKAIAILNVFVDALAGNAAGELVTLRAHTPVVKYNLLVARSVQRGNALGQAQNVSGGIGFWRLPGTV